LDDISRNLKTVPSGRVLQETLDKVPSICWWRCPIRHYEIQWKWSPNARLVEYTVNRLDLGQTRLAETAQHARGTRQESDSVRVRRCNSPQSADQRVWRDCLATMAATRNWWGILMSKYVWQHKITGESERLRLMSDLLDHSSRDHISRLPVPDDGRCLEIGAGNGSLSQWLASAFRPQGKILATDLAPELMDGIARDNLEVRALDIVHDSVEEGTYDLIVVRALLHHLPTRMDVVETMEKALKPGGWLFIQEPDFYPTLVAEPKEEADFWVEFLNWSATRQIDYFVGRKIPPRLQQLGMQNITAEGHTQLYPGGSTFARWWQLSIEVAAKVMLADGAMTTERLDRFMALYDDPGHWTMTIAFTASSAQRPLS
jgi:2-polyprenyl-3-methyl-5-hydroxy-6-metoxy-1,4-benzoquinol methylase